MSTEKECLLWVGQPRTTWGQPNPKTGRLSLYGNYKLFKTFQDRKNYVDSLRLDHGEIAVCGSRKTLRKYDLGCSLSGYNVYIDLLPYS